MSNPKSRSKSKSKSEFKPAKKKIRSKSLVNRLPGGLRERSAYRALDDELLREYIVDRSTNNNESLWMRVASASRAGHPTSPPQVDDVSNLAAENLLETEKAGSPHTSTIRPSIEPSRDECDEGSADSSARQSAESRTVDKSGRSKGPSRPSARRLVELSVEGIRGENQPKTNAEIDREKRERVRVLAALHNEMANGTTKRCGPGCECHLLKRVRESQKKALVCECHNAGLYKLMTAGFDDPGDFNEKGWPAITRERRHRWWTKYWCLEGHKPKDERLINMWHTQTHRGRHQGAPWAYDIEGQLYPEKKYLEPIIRARGLVDGEDVYGIYRIQQRRE